MDKVGILVVSYGAREAAIVDLLSISEEYSTKLFIADKQRNPFNIERAEDHQVISGLDVKDIGHYAAKHKDEIDFAIVGPEKPIIEGVRDYLEESLGIPTICPTKAYALEGSKIRQRQLLENVIPEVNVRFKLFYLQDFKNENILRNTLYDWLDELDGQAVVKPDSPAAGKGVGVWGDHFSTREELYRHFKENLNYGPVIVEEKIEGEESSFQAFCDGSHIVPLPNTRDYKRAFEEDKGPNTGGMGSYKNVGNVLPFLSENDWRTEIRGAERLFQALKGRGSNPNLLGVPLYIAYIHTGKDVKILEINSRPGDPEIINILPVIEEDLVEICYKILDGDLRSISLKKDATVVIYKVPPTYGDYLKTYPEKVDRNQLSLPVDLSKAQAISQRNPDKLRVYPASMELRDNQIYPLKSRAVCTVGIGDSISKAREISLDALEKIQGGALWYRRDIASYSHRETSIKKMRRLKSL